MLRNVRSVSRTRRFVIWPAEASALWLFWGMFRLLPRHAAIALGAVMGEAIGPFLLDRSAKMSENLAHALPALSPTKRRRVVRRIWGNFARVLADYPHL